MWLLKVCLLLLSTCLVLLFDFRLFVLSCNRNLDWGGDVHTKLFHCMKVNGNRYLNCSSYSNLLYSYFLFSIPWAVTKLLPLVKMFQRIPKYLALLSKLEGTLMILEHIQKNTLTFFSKKYKSSLMSIVSRSSKMCSIEPIKVKKFGRKLFSF